MSIKDLVYEVTNKDTHAVQRKNLTHSKGNAQCAVEYLTNCKDGQFPDLIMDRHVFSFNNGIYHVKHRRADGSFGDKGHGAEGDWVGKLAGCSNMSEEKVALPMRKQ